MPSLAGQTCATLAPSANRRFQTHGAPPPSPTRGDTLLLPAGPLLMRRAAFQKDATTGTHHGAIRHGRLQTSPRRHPHLASMGRSRQPSRRPPLLTSGGPAKLLATVVVRRPEGVSVGDHFRFIELSGLRLPDANIGRMWPPNTRTNMSSSIATGFTRPTARRLAHGIGIVHGAHTIAVINSYISGLNCIALTGNAPMPPASAAGAATNPSLRSDLQQFYRGRRRKHSVRR